MQPSNDFNNKIVRCREFVRGLAKEGL